jgi:hypothetical protein
MVLSVQEQLQRKINGLHCGLPARIPTVNWYHTQFNDSIRCCIALRARLLPFSSAQLLRGCAIVRNAANTCTQNCTNGHYLRFSRDWAKLCSGMLQAALGMGGAVAARAWICGPHAGLQAWRYSSSRTYPTLGMSSVFPNTVPCLGCLSEFQPVCCVCFVNLHSLAPSCTYSWHEDQNTAWELALHRNGAGVRTPGKE